MARIQWKLCVTVRNCCFLYVFICVGVLRHKCTLALVCTDLFSTLFSPISLSLFLPVSPSQVFWGHCINALIHSIILFWFPLKMLEHGK